MNMIRNSVNRALGRDYTSLGSHNSSATQSKKRNAGFTTKIWSRLIGAVVAIFTIYCMFSYLSNSGNITDSSRKLKQESSSDSRLLSKHCDNPVDGKPLIQYVLMLDAGSTGSRIHVYKFNNCKNRPELEDEVFEQIKPGLSSFNSDDIGAAKSLDSLMDTAMKHVPESHRTCTPVSVKATAGLRLLGNYKSTKILNAVRNRLVKEYPFPLAKEENPVAVMEGRDEGVFAWITVNYLLNTIGVNGTKTAGTFDLGGGSAQIVFEPSSKSSSHFDNLPTSASVDDYKHSFSYNKLHYSLYQHSYLGYGLMSAREKMLKEIVKSSFVDENFSVSHPCLPPHYEKSVDSKEYTNPIKLVGKEFTKTPPGNSVGSTKNKSGFEQCLTVARNILNVSDKCPVQPCSFSGAYQPTFQETFDSNPFYVFSYFYDRTDPFKLGPEFKLSDIKKLAEKVCHHDHSLFASADEIKELEEESHYCLDLTYIYSLLKYGIGVSDNRVLKTTRKINDVETGWCLGAALSILSQHDYCSASIK